MANFHLMHCIPNKLMHGLYGYLEIIQSVEWGLKRLGHQVSYGINQARLNAQNIVFGAHVLPHESLLKLPKESIVYNFEQMRGLDLQQIRPEVFEIARRFEIWDYAAANLEGWQSLGRADVKLVPVGYAPILSRIPATDNQDIDVLIYGKAGQQRLRCFDKLSRSGLTTLFVSGLYGEARDQLIARSKLIFNSTAYERSKIFEIARVSYLLANRKAVVSVIDEQTFIEPDIKPCCVFTSEEDLIQTCVKYLDNHALRTQTEAAGFEIFSRRNVADILRSALIS